jgi:hypothetical protein
VYKWTGNIGIASLPNEIKKDLRRRIKKTLNRHAVPFTDTKEIVRELTDEVSFAYSGRKHKLEQSGAGRPLNGPANLLSVNVADVLMRHGVRGSWLGYGDDNEAGKIGPVAELEAIAQTAYREACDEPGAVMARPARISKARKILGKIDRN